MNARTDIERAILGACILENAYGYVCHVLRVKNFSTPQHQAIWQAMGSLYPHTPIDHFSILRSLRAQRGNLSGNEHTLIAGLTQHVHSASNIVPWAFTLLELCFREQLVAAINQHRVVHSKDIELIPHLDEALRHAEDQTNDIFKAIPVIHHYLKAKGLKQAADDLAEINEHINTRIMHIKAYDKVAHLEQALHQAKEDLEQYEQEAAA